VIALLALLFAGAAYYVIRQNKSESGTVGANKDYIPAPVEKPQYTPPKATKPVEQPAAIVAPPVKDSLRFVLRATEPVWVSIAPDGLPAYLAR